MGLAVVLETMSGKWPPAYFAVKVAEQNLRKLNKVQGRPEDLFEAELYYRR